MEEIVSAMREQTPANRSAARKVVLGLVLLAGLATFAGSVYIAVRAYSPVLFADEWSVPMAYRALGGHYPLWKFWAQHNEHRIPFIKALQLLDIFLLKWDNRPLLVLNWIIQVCMLGAVTWFLHGLRRFTKTELATLAAVTAFVVFNPNQMQNFEWAFQSTFLSAFLFAVVALSGISFYAHRERESAGKHSAPGWLVLGVSAAFLAECNLASGVLTWVLLPVCGALLGLKRRIILLLSVAGLAGIGVYMIGYRSPGNLSNPLVSIRHPNVILGFVVAYFSESWHFVFDRLGSVATILAISAVVWLVVQWIRKREPLEPVQGFALSVALMMLVTASVTALGREGLVQAEAGRYQTPAMLFWWAIGLLLMAGMTRPGMRSRLRANALIAFQIAFLVVFIAEARRFPELLAQHLETRAVRSTAGLAVEAGIYDAGQIRLIYPHPEAVPPTYRFMVRKGLIAPPFREFQNVDKNINSVYTLLPPGSCAGSTETIHRIAIHPDGKQDLFAAGWGYDPAKRITFESVLAAAPDGTILGVGISGVPRPDVAAAQRTVPGNTGWHLYAVSEGLVHPLLVYGVLPETNEACLLPGAQKTPATPALQSLPAPSSISDTLVGYIERLNGAVITNATDANHPLRVGRGEGVRVEGWVMASDGAGAMDQIFGVHNAGNVAAEVVSRSDVAGAFKNGSLLMSGYRITFPVGALGPGLQSIQIVGSRNDRYYKLPKALYVYLE